jgi:hypothetical protein
MLPPAISRLTTPTAKINPVLCSESLHTGKERILCNEFCIQGKRVVRPTRKLVGIRYKG